MADNEPNSKKPASDQGTPAQETGTATPPKRFWPRAVIMIVAVVLLFMYIRDLAKEPVQTAPTTPTDKTAPLTSQPEPETGISEQEPEVVPDKESWIPPGDFGDKGYPTPPPSHRQQPYYPMTPYSGYRPPYQGEYYPHPATPWDNYYGYHYLPRHHHPAPPNYPPYYDSPHHHHSHQPYYPPGQYYPAQPYYPPRHYPPPPHPHDYPWHPPYPQSPPGH